MSLGEFWKLYHTPISLVLGPLLTYSIFRWVRLRLGWKLVVLAAALFLTIGLWGIVLNAILAASVALAFFFGAPALWIGGLVALGLWGDFRYSEIAWWQTFLICGVMGIAAMFLDLGIKFAVAYVIASLKPRDPLP